MYVMIRDMTHVWHDRPNKFTRSRGVKTQKEREISGWRDGGRVEERGRASAEKEKFTIEYTFRHPMLKRKLVVLGDVTVCCLSLVDPSGTYFSQVLLLNLAIKLLKSNILLLGPHNLVLTPFERCRG